MGLSVMLVANVLQRVIGLLRNLGFCHFLSDADLGQWSLANSFFVIGARSPCWACRVRSASSSRSSGGKVHWVPTCERSRSSAAGAGHTGRSHDRTTQTLCVADLQ